MTKVLIKELNAYVPVNAINVDDFLSIRPRKNTLKDGTAVHCRSKSVNSIDNCGIISKEPRDKNGDLNFTIRNPFATLEDALKVRLLRLNSNSLYPFILGLILK